MKKKMSDKKKFMAYVLNKDPDFDCSMNKVADLFGVSQSTVSTSIKEIGFKRQIMNLTNELSEAKEQLMEQNLQNENSIRVIKVDRYDDKKVSVFE